MSQRAKSTKNVAIIPHDLRRQRPWVLVAGLDVAYHVAMKLPTTDYFAF